MAFRRKRRKTRSAAASCPKTMARLCCVPSWTAWRRNSPGAAVLLHQHALSPGRSHPAGRRLGGPARPARAGHPDHRLGLQRGQSLRRHGNRRLHPPEETHARSALLPDCLRSGHAEVPAVILINLLPHREAARKRRRETFQVVMFASALGGLAIAALIYLWFQATSPSSKGATNCCAARSSCWKGRSRRSPASRRKSPPCRRARRRWKTCRPTATCQSTCSTNWWPSCPMRVHHQSQAGQRGRDHAGHGPVQRARVGDAAQLLRQHALVHQARAGGDRCRQRVPDPQGSAPRGFLQPALQAGAQRQQAGRCRPASGRGKPAAGGKPASSE